MVSFTQSEDGSVPTPSRSRTPPPIPQSSTAPPQVMLLPLSLRRRPPSIYAESNGQGFDGGFGGSDDPILPPPSDMLPEEGFALREWNRQNAIQLEEKVRQEKELFWFR